MWPSVCQGTAEPFKKTEAVLRALGEVLHSVPSSQRRGVGGGRRRGDVGRLARLHPAGGGADRRGQLVGITYNLNDLKM